MNDPFGTGEYDPRPRRSGLTIVAVVVAMLAGGAVLALVVFGGGSAEDREEASAIGGSGGQSGQETSTTSNPAVVPRGESPRTEPEDETADGDSGAEGSGEGESGGDEADGSEQNQAASSAQNVSNEGEGLPANGSSGADRSSGEDEGGRDRGEDEQPGSYDPLGTDAKPGDLTSTDRDRARFAVAEFVSAAYGFAGKNATGYGRAIDSTVSGPDFYFSPGGEQVQELVQSFNKEPEKSKAVLERFEITTTEPDKVVATAYYEAGPVDGPQSRYAQRITLEPDGAVYKVGSASERQEV